MCSSSQQSTMVDQQLHTILMATPGTIVKRGETKGIHSIHKPATTTIESNLSNGSKVRSKMR